MFVLPRKELTGTKFESAAIVLENLNDPSIVSIWGDDESFNVLFEEETHGRVGLCALCGSEFVLLDKGLNYLVAGAVARTYWNGGEFEPFPFWENGPG